jgi:hypothetical protein
MPAIASTATTSQIPNLMKRIRSPPPSNIGFERFSEYAPDSGRDLPRF